MRSDYDALRSLADYCAANWPTYDVYHAEEQSLVGAGRPMVVVRPVGPTLTRSQGWHTAELTQPFSANFHPDPPERDHPDLVHELAHQTAQLRDQVRRMFLFGGTGGYARRIPLFDYAGLPDIQTAKANNAQPVGYLRVEDLQTSERAADEDQYLWVVTASLRCTWMVQAPVRTNMVPLEEIVVSPDDVG